MKIKLYNRDGADLYLKKIKDIDPTVSEWKLEVDKEHSYCLNYLRVIFDPQSKDNTAIDPSGGPFLSVGDELDYFPKSYKIFKITSNLTLLLSERNKGN